jgi:PAS domain S-box-containing protein
MIVVPIPHRGTFIGVLKLHAAEPHGLAAADIPVAQLLVGALAAGLSSVAEAEAIDALHASQARLRLATEAAAIGTWDVDPATGALCWDARCKALFGLPPDADVSFDLFLEALHPDDRGATEQAIAAALDPSGAGEYDIAYRTIGRVDGMERWIAAKGRAVFDGDGRARRAVRFIGTVIDISERKRAEAELRHINATLEARVAERTAALAHEAAIRQAAEEQLRQAQRMQALGKLTGGIAHDFNNLLAVISGSTEMLRRPGLDEARRLSLSDAIARATDRATALTAQLLAFARCHPLRPEVFDLNARMRDSAARLQRLIGSRYRVETDFQADLWQAKADPNQLEIALFNVAMNARDAMPEGGVITITTRNMELPAEGERAAGDYVGVAVGDTGSGISPELIDRVFEPFFTTKEMGRGTGLGLSQVWGFAAQSGGDVRITSQMKQGTTVFLHLPRARLDPAAEAADVSEVFFIGKGTILMVEDNPDVAELGQVLLEELGYDVVSADSAERALVLLSDSIHVDLVFSDVVMPGMSGIELAGMLRRQHPELPVVLTTGYSDVVPGEETGEVPILAKPYKLSTLASTFQQALAVRPTSRPPC